MGAEDSLLATIAPKSATTAIAVEIADRLGSVAGVIVISSSIFGAAFGLLILQLGGVRDERAIGFALGVASSGIGTAGGFASLGMILNALLTILLVRLFIATP